MSRRRPAARVGGMPGWLAEYRPEDWTDDPGDVLGFNYGRIRWAAARRVWFEGGDPRPYIDPPPLNN